MVDDQDPDELSLLLLAARQGDRGALSRLLRGLWPWLRWKAGSLVSRAAPIGVSSLTQETALRFSRKLSKVMATDSPSVKALLHRIMRNTAVSAHRSAAAAKRDPAQRLLAELNPESAASIEEQLEQAESQHRLRVAILRLPDRQRQAIQLMLDDVSIDDIAKHHQCSPGAVHMLLQRAKCQLAEWLAEAGPEAIQ